MLTSLLIAMMMVGDSLTITFTGDLLLDRGIREVIDHRGVDRLFSPYVDSVFQSSNLVVANLECPVTKIVQPMYKQYKETLDKFFREGIERAKGTEDLITMVYLRSSPFLSPFCTYSRC